MKRGQAPLVYLARQATRTDPGYEELRRSRNRNHSADVMAHSKLSLLLAVVLCAAIIECKIVLPHKLRYLENMLNADLLSKASRMRQRTESNAGPENRVWPVLGLGKYQEEKPSGPPPMPPFLMNSLVQRRNANPKI